MDNKLYESGVLVEKMSPEEQKYVSLYLQVCKKYNINLEGADQMELDFVKARTDYLLKEQIAI